MSRRGSRGAGRSNQQQPIAEQARRWIDARASRGQSKADGAELRSNRTVGHYRDNLRRAAEHIEREHQVKNLKSITTEQAQQYINQRIDDGLQAKTVQAYAQALETLPGVGKLDTPSRSIDDKPTNSRAYTSKQIQEIKNVVSDRSQVAIQIQHETGCRVQDLASIRLYNERPIINARVDRLIPERFVGREDWVKVTFIGKGGHEYESRIRPETAADMERYRLAQDRMFTNRGLNKDNPIPQRYNLPAGKNLSDLFTNASTRALGFSNGAHGVRHTFAQDRVAELQAAGRTWSQALEQTSQSMGHYRSEEIHTYLR